MKFFMLHVCKHTHNERLWVGLCCEMVQIIGSEIGAQKPTDLHPQNLFKENEIWFNRFPLSRTFLTSIMVTDVDVNVLVFHMISRTISWAMRQRTKNEKNLATSHDGLQIDSSLSTSLLWDYSPLMVRLVGHVLRRHMLWRRLRHIDLRWMHCVVRVNHFRLLFDNPFWWLWRER